jgi:hypothetical protein
MEQTREINNEGGQANLIILRDRRTHDLGASTGDLNVHGMILVAQVAGTNEHLVEQIHRWRHTLTSGFRGGFIQHLSPTQSRRH